MVTPAPPRSPQGNRTTALRWARLLRTLGHRVAVKQSFSGENWDLLIALHARRSAASVTRFHKEYPQRPRIVALTGTDLHLDLPRGNLAAQRSLKLATRLVALHADAADALPRAVRAKLQVIYQSVTVPAWTAAAASARRTRSIGDAKNFEVFVVGHLRPVKDPFRAAMAVRRLPSSSRIQVAHFGVALSESMRRRALQESERNDRYRWHGHVSHAKLLQALRRRAALLVQTSRAEGGPHTISEACVAGVPVLATDIPGSTGLLGRDYPGLFPVGDTARLRELLQRAEGDRAFYRALAQWCRRQAKLFDPERELASWRRLLGELQG
ncbi:MAG: TIGR04348 family glycosyltransferase [Planctomycetota bacterium]|nr:MAG: TIGR04348 family glycosyltransferase [Planctomycetota bacterium]REJ95150.1 MAG: TIGR04348 family glycosyltransferase [Planctomycetota bacterium]REK30294.1 MAG: TIGR04348 family glycosyltransferase [Planctomycetota bacterium]REK44643.1 MAG: TIGR04348 family glycosyltransferase [Planctomycetota bacterium]